MSSNVETSLNVSVLTSGSKTEVVGDSSTPLGMTTSGYFGVNRTLYDVKQD